LWRRINRAEVNQPGICFVLVVKQRHGSIGHETSGGYLLRL
jgi:hypothetical protein